MNVLKDCILSSVLWLKISFYTIHFESTAELSGKVSFHREIFDMFNLTTKVLANGLKISRFHIILVAIGTTICKLQIVTIVYHDNL